MTRPRRILALLVLLPLPVSAPPAHADGVGAPTSPRVVNDRCPVMEEEPASPQHEVQFRGYAVRFCCEKCQDRFADDPVPYLSRLPQLPTAMVQQVVAESQQKAQARHAAGMVDPWTPPLLLTLAAVVMAWLVLRIAHRIRSAHSTARGAEMHDIEEDLRGAHGPGAGN